MTSLTQLQAEKKGEPLKSIVRRLSSSDLKCPVQRLRNDVVIRAAPVCMGCERFDMPFVSTARSNYLNESPPYEDIARGYQLKVATEDCKWVSDFLKDEVWHPGDFIFLQSGTGRGKTTFVETVLSDKYYRILYLTNRSESKSQFEERNRHNYLMTVMSYQAFELNAKIDGTYLDNFDIVVCDEYHYTHADSTLSGTTGITVRKLMQSEHCIKLFISATAQYGFEYLFPKIKAKLGDLRTLQCCKYYLMQERLNNIASVSSGDWQYLIPIIKASECKWILFVDSRSKGSWLEAELGEDAIFVDSEGLQNNKHVQNVLQEITQNERFTQRILITTSLLESGVNLKDKELTCMVLDINSKIQLKQMLGRKRFIDDEDYLNLYIIHRERYLLQRDQMRLFEELAAYQKAESTFRRTKWPDQLINQDGQEGREYRRMIYNDQQQRKFCFNELGKFDIQKRISELNELLNSPSQFEVKLQWLFGSASNSLRVGITMERITADRIQEIYAVIEPYIGREMQKLGKDANTLRTEITAVHHKHFSLDKEDKHRSGRTLSFSKINNMMEKLGIPVIAEGFYKNKIAFIRIISTENTLVMKGKRHG